MNLNLRGLSSQEKAEAKVVAGDIFVEEINKFLDKSSSPVEGGAFKKKKADGDSSKLFEFGDMRASITFEGRGENKVEVGIFNESEAPKAFNHNTGDTLPQRAFIPERDEQFSEKIMSKVNQAIKEIKDRSQVRVDITSDLVEEVLTIDFEF